MADSNANLTVRVRSHIPGGLRILVERDRQVREEGYTVAHDSEHDPIDLVHAAQTYLRIVEHRLRGVELSKDEAASLRDGAFAMRLWPWGDDSLKPTTSDRDLVKAGALIAAALDRIDEASR